MTKYNKLALLGGTPLNTRKTPLYNTIGIEEKEAVNKVLDSGVLSGFAAQNSKDFYGGEHIEALERDFCNYFKSKNAIAVNSATSGLHIALAAMEIGPGDEVIVPPYTMSATSTCVLYTGAIPIFADIDEDTFCLDPISVEKNINSNTKGILAVNLFGHPAPLLELKKIAKKYNLFLIEDNAQAPGAKIDNILTGTIGDAAIFSFNRHKVMQCGEGGIVICKDDQQAMKMRLIRNHGEGLVDGFGINNIINIVGLNYRMPNMEAVIAKIQFSKLDRLNNYRIELAQHFTKLLLDIDGITPPKVKKGFKHSYYLYVIKYNKAVIGISRELFSKAIEAEGFILKAGYTKPLYMSPLYQKKIGFGNTGFPFTANSRYENLNYSKGLCPVAEKIEKNEIMWTPMIYAPLNKKDIEDFVEAIKKVIANKESLKN